MAAGTVQLAPSPSRRAALSRRVRWLVAATIGYNLIEATVAIAAGTVASSTALIGFGLDSVIEVSSAAAVAWQFATRDPQRHEKTTLRIIACSFFALAVYVTVTAVRALALSFAGGVEWPRVMASGVGWGRRGGGSGVGSVAIRVWGWWVVGCGGRG